MSKYVIQDTSTRKYYKSMSGDVLLHSIDVRWEEFDYAFHFADQQAANLIADMLQQHFPTICLRIACSEREAFFIDKNLDGVAKEVFSPSGNFRLTIKHYRTSEGCWNYSRGIITRVSDDTFIADIKRNYHVFWHEWCQHSNGNEYLLCGEDYQGQTIVNCTLKKTSSYLPKSADKGAGFCWVEVKVSPDSHNLAVYGCYWACPYELRVYDFSAPDVLPYKLRVLEKDDPFISDIRGWRDPQTIIGVKVRDVRKSDGKFLEELTEEEEKKAIDSEDIDEVTEDVPFNLADFKPFKEEEK